MNISLSIQIMRLARYLVPGAERFARGPGVSDHDAREALVQIVKPAYRRLAAGMCPEDVEAHWPAGAPAPGIGLAAGLARARRVLETPAVHPLPAVAESEEQHVMQYVEGWNDALLAVARALEAEENAARAYEPHGGRSSQEGA